MRGLRSIYEAHLAVERLEERLLSLSRDERRRLDLLEAEASALIGSVPEADRGDSFLIKILGSAALLKQDIARETKAQAADILLRWRRETGY